MSEYEPQKELNDFDKEVEDIKEWQDNQFNPGHYIGTGRVPRPISRLGKYPKLLILVGLIMIIFSICAIIIGNSWSNMISEILPALLGGAFIYGGIQRLTENKKK